MAGGGLEKSVGTRGREGRVERDAKTWARLANRHFPSRISAAYRSVGARRAVKNEMLAERGTQPKGKSPVLVAKPR